MEACCLRKYKSKNPKDYCSYLRCEATIAYLAVFSDDLRYLNGMCSPVFELTNIDEPEPIFFKNKSFLCPLHQFFYSLLYIFNIYFKVNQVQLVDSTTKFR
jgi:hypothetical protein